MKIFRLNEMTKGWFVGSFNPSVYRTDECEVGVKEYIKGTVEPKHYHKKAKEITVIVRGKAKFNELEVSSGDIVLIDENEATRFEALDDVITVVFKSKSVLNDKYIIDK